MFFTSPASRLITANNVLTSPAIVRLLTDLMISSKIIYILGTKIKVKIVENKSPPITVIASGDQRFEASERSSAMGISVRIVVLVVSRIGRNLSLPACIIAFNNVTLSFSNY